MEVFLLNKTWIGMYTLLIITKIHKSIDANSYSMIINKYLEITHSDLSSLFNKSYTLNVQLNI